MAVTYICRSCGARATGATEEERLSCPKCSTAMIPFADEPVDQESPTEFVAPVTTDPLAEDRKEPRFKGLRVARPVGSLAEQLVPGTARSGTDETGADPGETQSVPVPTAATHGAVDPDALEKILRTARENAEREAELILEQARQDADRQLEAYRQRRSAEIDEEVRKLFDDRRRIAEETILEEARDAAAEANRLKAEARKEADALVTEAQTARDGAMREKTRIEEELAAVRRELAAACEEADRQELDGLTGDDAAALRQQVRTLEKDRARAEKTLERRMRVETGAKEGAFEAANSAHRLQFKTVLILRLTGPFLLFYGCFMLAQANRPLWRAGAALLLLAAIGLGLWGYVVARQLKKSIDTLFAFFFRDRLQAASSNDGSGSSSVSISVRPGPKAAAPTGPAASAPPDSGPTEENKSSDKRKLKRPGRNSSRGSSVRIRKGASNRKTGAKES